MLVKNIKLILIFSCLHNSPVFAESLRCGTQLVEIGETKAEVIGKCGQPETTDTFCRNEYIQGKFGTEVICHNVELWTFNRGTGTFLMKVEFEQGEVKNITHGDRTD